MTTENEEEFFSIIKGMAEAYGAKISSDLISFYWAMLERESIDDIRSAVISVARRSEYFPKPGEICSAIGSCHTSKNYYQIKERGLRMDARELDIKLASLTQAERDELKRGGYYK